MADVRDAVPITITNEEGDTMKRYERIRIATAIVMMGLLGTAWAGGPGFRQALLPDVTAPTFFTVVPSSPGVDLSACTPAAMQEEGGGLNLGKAHKVLGYSTLVAMAVTAFSSSSHGLHCDAAYATAGLGVATCLTGFIEYGSYLSLKTGLLQKPNLHVLLGTAGTLLCTAAVIQADTGHRSGHSGLGIAGGVAMAVSFVNIKFDF